MLLRHCNALSRSFKDSITFLLVDRVCAKLKLFFSRDARSFVCQFVAPHKDLIIIAKCEDADRIESGLSHRRTRVVLHTSCD